MKQEALAANQEAFEAAPERALAMCTSDGLYEIPYTVHAVVRAHTCSSCNHAFRSLFVYTYTLTIARTGIYTLQEALAADREENEAAKERALAMCTDERESVCAVL